MTNEGDRSETAFDDECNDNHYEQLRLFTGLGHPALSLGVDVDDPTLASFEVSGDVDDTPKQLLSCARDLILEDIWDSGDDFSSFDLDSNNERVKSEVGPSEIPFKSTECDGSCSHVSDICNHLQSTHPRDRFGTETFLNMDKDCTPSANANNVPAIFDENLQQNETVKPSKVDSPLAQGSSTESYATGAILANGKRIPYDYPRGAQVAQLHFHDLPQEIILRIFSFLQPRELCRFVAPVCVRWLQYSRDPSLWNCITCDEFKDVSDELFMKVLTSWCPLVKTVDFKCRATFENNDFDTIFSNCRMIESVSFAFCPQLSDDILTILRKHCKYIQHINMEGTGIKDSSFFSLVGLPLTDINASHCTYLSDDGVIFLAKNFKGLSAINFDGVQWITHDALEVVVQFHCDTLKHIILDGADLTDETIQLLSKCKNTRIFHLSFCDSLTDNCLKWIKQFQNLQSLQLKKGINFTNGAILDLLNELRIGQTLNPCGLTHLNLTECSSLSDECLLCIADGCPNLLFLSLSWCWEVTDDGIDFIMDSCHKLVQLCLCGLHELYGAPFARIPKETKQLKYLDLRQCNKVSDDLLADLVQQMPSLTILNYYGDVVREALHFWSLDRMPEKLPCGSCHNSVKTTLWSGNSKHGITSYYKLTQPQIQIVPCDYRMTSHVSLWLNPSIVS